MNAENRSLPAWHAYKTPDGTVVQQGKVVIATVAYGSYHAKVVEGLLKLGTTLVGLLSEEQVEQEPKEPSQPNPEMDGPIDVDLTDIRVNAILKEWNPEIQAAINSRQAEEVRKGVPIVEQDRFLGQAYANNRPVKHFMKAVAGLPVLKSLVLLIDWEKSCPDPNALAKSLPEFQLAGATSMTEAKVVIDRFEHLRDAGVLPQLFGSETEALKIEVLDRVIQILTNGDYELIEDTEDPEIE